MRGRDQAFPLKLRENAAVEHQRDQVFRKSLGLKHDAGLAVADGEIVGRHLGGLAFGEGRVNARALQGEQTEVDGVAEEYIGRRFNDQAGDADVAQRQRRRDRDRPA